MTQDLKMVGFDVVMREVEKVREAVLARRELSPPAVGEHIAWSMVERGACTSGLSSLHRVGEPKKGEMYTTCGVPIPEPVRWLSLSPAFANALAPCGFCEAFPSGVVVKVA